MADPNTVPSAFGDDLCASLAPLLTSDPANDYAGKTYLYAIAQMMAQLDLLARQDDAGTPAWGVILDPVNAPEYALPYVAQYSGARIPAGTSAGAARTIIAEHLNYKRGTPAALIAAAKANLTGTKYVALRERDTDALHASIYVRTSETDLTAGTYAVIRDNIGLSPLVAALYATKPARVVLSLIVASQTTIDELAGTIDGLAGTIDSL